MQVTKIKLITKKLNLFEKYGDITELIDAQGLVTQLVKETQDKYRKLYTTSDYEV